MEMCFHSNQHPSSIKHPFISLYFKYQSFIFSCFPDMNSPVFPSLDDIYCTSFALHLIDYKVTTRSLHQEKILHKHEKKHSMKLTLLDWANCNYILTHVFCRFHCTLCPFPLLTRKYFNYYHAVLQVQMNWELKHYDEHYA